LGSAILAGSCGGDFHLQGKGGDWPVNQSVHPVRKMA
jgi:hypothetical protein